MAGVARPTARTVRSRSVTIPGRRRSRHCRPGKAGAESPACRSIEGGAFATWSASGGPTRAPSCVRGPKLSARRLRRVRPESSDRCWQQMPFASASKRVGKRCGRSPGQPRASSTKRGSRRTRRQNGARSLSSENSRLTRTSIARRSSARTGAASNATRVPCCVPRRSAGPRERTTTRVQVPSSSTRSIMFRVERRRTRAVSAKSKEGAGRSEMCKRSPIIGPSVNIRRGEWRDGFSACSSSPLAESAAGGNSRRRRRAIGYTGAEVGGAIGRPSVRTRLPLGGIRDPAQSSR